MQLLRIVAYGMTGMLDLYSFGQMYVLRSLPDYDYCVPFPATPTQSIR